MKKILFGFLFLSVNSYADTYYQYNGCLKLTITNSSSEFDSQENQYILHEVKIGKRNIDACRNFRPYGAYYLEEKKQSGLLIIGKLISITKHEGHFGHMAHASFLISKRETRLRIQSENGGEFLEFTNVGERVGEPREL